VFGAYWCCCGFGLGTCVYLEVVFSLVCLGFDCYLQLLIVCLRGIIVLYVCIRCFVRWCVGLGGFV